MLYIYLFMDGNQKLISWFLYWIGFDSAKWFTKEEVKAAFDRIQENPGLIVNNENGDLIIPPRGAIAHDLLRDWVSS